VSGLTAEADSDAEKGADHLGDEGMVVSLGQARYGDRADNAHVLDADRKGAAVRRGDRDVPHALVRDTGAEHSASGGKSALLADAAKTLGTDEIVSNAAVLLFGGIETTEGMISNAILHMLTYGSLAVEESLRLEPAAAMVDRYATRDGPLGGTLVGRGDQVTVSITGANRDPALFGDPDVYDPSRVNAGKHLAFAHGPHFCVGAHLAQLPGLRLSGQAVPRGVVFRKPPELYATWEVA
jgi:cytochrome P450